MTYEKGVPQTTGGDDTINSIQKVHDMVLYHRAPKYSLGVSRSPPTAKDYGQALQNSNRRRKGGKR